MNPTPDDLDRIRAALESLEYGTITIHVTPGHVDMEVTRRERLKERKVPIVTHEAKA